MRYPKLRELKEAITALLRGPYTSKYPYKPHTAAKRFRGKPTPSEGCIGCRACELVCPARAIEAKDSISKDKANRVMVWHLDECHYCGQCELCCTTREDMPPGVKLTGEFELAGFSRSALVSKTTEQPLAICETCRDVVTTHKHLDWLFKRLGPLAFSNPTLFISALKGAGLADAVTAGPENLNRGDRIKVLCAKCRRKITQEK
jgi:formate hydrogenlyase subunit 6/NADH:ubiquinone oxidoreductase subunit I